jgi:beta-lactamase regulating signal transducer with metallopeptidase domain
MTNLFQAYLACSVTMAAVMVVLFVLSPWLGKRYRGKTLYIAWLVALLGFLVPLRLTAARPALTAQMPAAMARPVFAALSASEPASSDGADVNMADASAILPTGGDTRLFAPDAAAGKAEPAETLTWTALAALVWLLGAAGTLTIHVTRHALFLRTVRRWQKPVNDPETLFILEEERRRLRILKPVALMLCPSVDSPM